MFRATVDALITAGIVNSRAEGLRWALSRLRDTRAAPASSPRQFSGLALLS
jgi:hypothetical protein